MGIDRNDQSDEIVIPKQDTTSLNSIPSDYPEDQITVITVAANGENHTYRITDGTQVKSIKDDVGMPNSRAQYTTKHGKTLVLNDNDRIADYVDDGETLALKPDAVFGHA